MIETLGAEAVDELAHPRTSVMAAIRALAPATGMRILDAGCGAGTHLGLFADAVAPGGTVVGLEVRAERVALATALHAARIAAGNIQVVAGDLHAIPAGFDPFDLVWTSLVLHHEPVPIETIRGLARAAKQGRRIAVMDGDGGGSFPLAPWPPSLELRLREAALRTEQEGNSHLPYQFAGYLGRQLPRLLRDAGLIEIQMHAFADMDRAPLRPARAEILRRWLVDSFGMRLRPHLTPHDWDHFRSLVTAGSPDDLLTNPDFFLSRTWFLAVGQTAA